MDLFAKPFIICHSPLDVQSKETNKTNRLSRFNHFTYFDCTSPAEPIFIPKGRIMKEQWKSVVGWEQMYNVSNHGRVQKVSSGRILKQAYHPQGYCIVNLTKPRRIKLVHTLVMWAFVGPRPNGYNCHHIDGDKSNNNLDNLKWITNKQNLQERHKAQGNNIVTDAQVRQMRHLHDALGWKARKIADIMKLTCSHVHKIIKRERHKDVV